MRYRISNGTEVHTYKDCPNEAALALRINVAPTFVGYLLIEVGYFVEELSQNQWVKMNPQPIYSQVTQRPTVETSLPRA